MTTPSSSLLPFAVTFEYRGPPLSAADKKTYDYVATNMLSRIVLDDSFLLDVAKIVARRVVEIHAGLAIGRAVPEETEEKVGRPETTYPALPALSFESTAALMTTLRSMLVSEALDDDIKAAFLLAWKRNLEKFATWLSATYPMYRKFPSDLVNRGVPGMTYDMSLMLSRIRIRFGRRSEAASAIVMTPRQETAIDLAVAALTNGAPPKNLELIYIPPPPPLETLEDVESSSSPSSYSSSQPSSPETPSAFEYRAEPVAVVDALDAGVVPSQRGLEKARIDANRAAVRRKNEEADRKRAEVLERREAETKVKYRAKLLTQVDAMRNAYRKRKETIENMETRLKESGPLSPVGPTESVEPGGRPGAGAKRPSIVPYEKKLADLDATPDDAKTDEQLEDAYQTLRDLETRMNLRISYLKEMMPPPTKRRKMATAGAGPARPRASLVSPDDALFEMATAAADKMTDVDAVAEILKSTAEDAGTDFVRIFHKLADQTPIFVGAKQYKNMFAISEAAAKMNGPMATLVKWLTVEGLDALSRRMAAYGVKLEMPDFYDVTVCARRMLWELSTAVEECLAFDAEQKAKKTKVRISPKMSWSHVPRVVVQAAKNLCNFKPKVNSVTKKQDQFGYGLFVSGSTKGLGGARPEVSTRADLYFTDELAHMRDYKLDRKFWDECSAESYPAPSGDANPVVGWERRLMSLVVGVLNQNTSGRDDIGNPANRLRVNEVRGVLERAFARKKMQPAVFADWFAKFVEIVGHRKDTQPSYQSEAGAKLAYVADLIRKRTIATACDWMALLANASIAKATFPAGVSVGDAWKRAVGAAATGVLDTVRRSLWQTNDYEAPRRKIDTVINSVFYAIECSSRTLVEHLNSQPVQGTTGASAHLGSTKFVEMLKSEQPSPKEIAEKLEARKRKAAAAGEEKSVTRGTVQLTAVKSMEGDTYASASPFFPCPDLTRLSIFACEPFSDSLLLVRNGWRRRSLPVLDLTRVHFYMPPKEMWMRAFLHRESSLDEVGRVSAILESFAKPPANAVTVLDPTVTNSCVSGPNIARTPINEAERARSYRPPLVGPRYPMEVGETRAGRLGRFGGILQLTYGSKNYESRTAAADAELDVYLSSSGLDPRATTLARWLRDNGCSSAWKLLTAPDPTVPVVSWIEYADDLRRAMLEPTFEAAISVLPPPGGGAGTPSSWTAGRTEEGGASGDLFLGGALPYAEAAFVELMYEMIRTPLGDPSSSMAKEIGNGRQWARFLALACGAMRTFESVHRSYARDSKAFYDAAVDAVLASSGRLMRVSGVEWYVGHPGTARDSAFSIPQAAADYYVANLTAAKRDEDAMLLDRDLESIGRHVLAEEMFFAVVHDEMLGALSKLCELADRVKLTHVADALRILAVGGKSPYKERLSPHELKEALEVPKFPDVVRHPAFPTLEQLQTSASRDEELANLLRDAPLDKKMALAQFNAEKKLAVLAVLRQFEQSKRCGHYGIADHLNVATMAPSGAGERTPMVYVPEPPRAQDEEFEIAVPDHIGDVMIEFKTWLKNRKSKQPGSSPAVVVGAPAVAKSDVDNCSHKTIPGSFSRASEDEIAQN